MEKIEKNNKKCKFCSKTFFSNNRYKLYCDNRCKSLRAYHKKPMSHEGVCEECNKSYTKNKSDQKYCCHTCAKRHCERRARYKKQFNIELVDYDVMLRYQGFGCAICGNRPQENQKLDVDHCHKSGQVRGLLCSQCNLALGQFKDNVVLLQNAINYLEGNKYA